MNADMTPLPWSFLDGGGEMGARIRAHDWSATPLGPPDGWPDALRTTVSMVLDSALLGIVLWGPDLRLLYNDAYAPALGERHPGALGCPIAEVWAETWRHLAPHFDRVLRTGRPHAETRLALPMTRDGRRVTTYWSYSLVAIRDGAGEIVGLLTQGLDITAGVESEDRLQVSEAHNRQILDSAVDFAIIATDLHGRITRWNDGARRVLGWTEDEMRGQPVDRFFTPEDVAAGQVGKEMRAALDVGRGVDERWHQRKGGERFWASGEMTVLRDEAGAAIGFVKVLRDRTQRRLADEALRASEARLSAIVHATSEVLFSLDAEWREMRQLTGTGTGTGTGTSTGTSTGAGLLAEAGAPNPRWLDEYIPAEEQPRVQAAIADAIRASAAFSLEHRVRLPDGGTGWMQTRAVPLFGADGAITEWFGAAGDVTARNEAASALERLNATLEHRVEAQTRERDRAWRLAQDLLTVCETDGTIVAVNAAWTRLLGWTAHELIGRGLAEFTHSDELETTDAAFAGMSERPLTQAFENRVRHRDGGYRWFAWTGAFEDGRVYAAGRDVTHDRERETILKDARDFSRLALSAVGGVGVWTYEIAGDQFFYDAAIADLYGIDPARGSTGLPRPQFLGNVHADDRDALRTTMAGGLVNAGDLELEYRISHPDGGVRWVLSRGHTYHDESGTPVRRTGVGVETTNRRETEAALRQSQKMEAVGQLTGGLAHDFNNLLTVVTGSLELLQTRVAQGRVKDFDRYVSAAQGAAKRAAALTHRLLAFSRQQALAPKPTDVNRLVTGIAELIGRTVGPEITLEPLVAADGLWSTLVDPGQLENALLNLCINARDAMPDGGRITIETGNKWLDERAARERELPAGEYVTLCVSDTGTGMPPQVIARAFDPFFTTKPIGKGTGLGLSMIYGFARQSGGQVRIYSEVGQGTAVVLYLPRHCGPEDTVARPPELTDAPRARQGETVLVLDDETTVRLLVTEVLETLGYRAIEAADGPACMQVLLSDERIDLLVTDVGLPGGMNGRQVADAARTIRPTLNVLFITGYAENAVLSHGHLDPGMHVLTKPFAMEALATRIRELIAG